MVRGRIFFLMTNLFNRVSYVMETAAIAKLEIWLKFFFTLAEY